jgi:hypothetical protein
MGSRNSRQKPPKMPPQMQQQMQPQMQPQMLPQMQQQMQPQMLPQYQMNPMNPNPVNPMVGPNLPKKPNAPSSRFGLSGRSRPKGPQTGPDPETLARNKFLAASNRFDQINPFILNNNNLNNMNRPYFDPYPEYFSYDVDFYMPNVKPITVFELNETGLFRFY